MKPHRGFNFSPIKSPRTDIEADQCKVSFSAVSRKGIIPTKPDKPNMDVYIAQQMKGVHLFAVFDGHGTYGYDCADFS